MDELFLFRKWKSKLYSEFQKCAANSVGLPLLLCSSPSAFSYSHFSAFQFCTFLNFAPKSKQSHVFLTKITPNSQMYFHVDIIQCVSTNFNFSSTTYISQKNMHQSISSYFSIQNQKIRQLNQICYHEHASEIVVRY